MTKIPVLIAVLLLLAGLAPAQTTRRHEAPAPPDAASVDSIVAALYASVSHAPGATPDFERMRGIFLYVGMFVPPKRPGQSEIMATDVDGLANRYRNETPGKTDKGEIQGFYEHEIARHTDCFGNVCQIFSTYESRHTPDAKPFERGVNSIQLVRDGTRWWIASVAWDAERPDNPIPASFLASPKS
jgi:hypothetical protein